MKLFDVVALTQDFPEKYLIRGQVGTIVEELEKGIFEVEFSDFNGKAYAMTAMSEKSLMPLVYEAITR